MIREKIIINNKLGMHARASAKFVAITSKFLSRINIIKDSQVINGKSIMGVMMLAANKGTELTIEIDGPDETQMQQAILDLINNYFGEPE